MPFNGRVPMLMPADVAARVMQVYAELPLRLAAVSITLEMLVEHGSSAHACLPRYSLTGP